MRGHPGFSGHHHTEETKARVSQVLKGRPNLALKGKPKSIEHRMKISDALTGKSYGSIPEETKRKISANVSIALKKLWEDSTYRDRLTRTRQGKRNSNWKGGITPKRYPSAFWQLRETIRIRDDKTCQLCGALESEFNRALDVNHIDHDKSNLSPMNLITLCRSCNSKINGREKVYYQLLLEARVKEMYEGDDSGG